MTNIRSIVSAYTDKERKAPPDLQKFVNLTGEAAQIARQHTRSWGVYGGQQLRERIMRAADLPAPDGGDIIHIGHGNGNITAGLAAVAQKHGCRIVAVNTGASDEERRLFAHVTLPYSEATLGKHTQEKLLTAVAKNDPDTEALIKKRFHWRFAFVSDKDKSFPAYLKDIMFFTACPVIAVDYCLCMDGPRLAFETAAVLLGRVPVRDARCREGYLVMP